MIINPLIVSVRSTDDIIISPIDPTMHKGGIGKLVSVVAMVAIPAFAPGIAASMGLSGAISSALGAGALAQTAGTVVGSAIAGAAMGAVSALVSGQKISVGALGGAIGGAVGGYLSTPTTTPLDYGADPTSIGSPASGGLQYSPGVGLAPSGVSPADAIFGPPATRGGTYSGFGAGSGAPLSVSEIYNETVSVLKDTIRDPKNLANVTLQAAASLAGEVMLPEGSLAQLSEEEKGLIELRKEELANLKSKNEEAYNYQVDLAKRFMVAAKQIDPTYFANQALAKSKVATGRKIKDFERNLALSNYTMTPGDRARVELDANRLSASKYDEGYVTGVGLQRDAMKSASEAFPTYTPNAYLAGLSGIGETYKGAREQADTERGYIQEMFAGLDTGLGQTDKEKEEANRVYLQVGKG